jgi:hypothetical protein
MGDVQVTAADLGKPREGKEPARGDDGAGEADEGHEQVALGSLASDGSPDP